MKAIGKYNHINCQKAVVDAKIVYNRVWASACNFDDVPIDSKFIIFSNKNPFVYYINKAYQILINRIYEYQNGGYVGLKISGCTIKERRIQKDIEIRQKVQKLIELRKQFKILETELN